MKTQAIFGSTQSKAQAARRNYDDPWTPGGAIPKARWERNQALKKQREVTEKPKAQSN